MKPLKHYQPFFDDLSTGLYPTTVQHFFAVNGKVSGSVGAIGEIGDDIVAVLHGPRGCAWHYRDSARRRHQPFYPLYTSDLTEEEIIFGGQEKLRTTIQDIWTSRHPKLILVVPTPISDILNDDIAAVCREARDEGIPVVSIKSELFSHRDKNYSKNRLKAIAEQKVGGDNRLEMELKGCGFTEALCALVNHVMEPQERVARSVNIETVGWGGEGLLALREIETLLNRCGVTVNCWIPSSPLESIRRAPAAELNLVKRVRWARMMRDRFGIDYLHLDTATRYVGFDGIATFYRDIAQKLRIEDEMEPVLAQAMETARAQTAQARQSLSGHRCALVSRGLQSAPFDIKIYAGDYGVRIDTVCVILTESARRNMELTDELQQKLMDRVRVAIALYSPGTQIAFNPDEAALDAVLSRCDAIIGTSDFTLEGRGAPLIPASIETTSLSFESYVRNVRRMARRVENCRTREHLILNDLGFTRENYPRFENRETIAARQMWERMWLRRKEEEP